jgi:hypothetical protein
MDVSQLDLKEGLGNFTSAMNPLELQKRMKELMKKDTVDIESDSALHLALS